MTDNRPPLAGATAPPCITAARLAAAQTMIDTAYGMLEDFERHMLAARYYLSEPDSEQDACECLTKMQHETPQ